VEQVLANKRIKLARQSVTARRGRGARSLSAVRWAYDGPTCAKGGAAA